MFYFECSFFTPSLRRCFSPIIVSMSFNPKCSFKTVEKGCSYACRNRRTDAHCFLCFTGPCCSDWLLWNEKMKTALSNMFIVVYLYCLINHISFYIFYLSIFTLTLRSTLRVIVRNDHYPVICRLTNNWFLFATATEGTKAITISISIRTRFNWRTHSSVSLNNFTSV